VSRARSAVALAATVVAGLAAGCSGPWAIRGTVHARLAPERRVLAIPTVGTEGVGPHVREFPPLRDVEVYCPACAGEARRVRTGRDGSFRIEVGQDRPEEPFRLVFFKRGYRPMEVLVLPRTRERKARPLLVLLTPDEDAGADDDQTPPSGTPPSGTPPSGGSSQQ
jgi:hypothetical protein